MNMKFASCILCVALLVVASTWTSAGASAVLFDLPGDINTDGTITSDDSRQLARAWPMPGPAVTAPEYDVDCDALFMFWDILAVEELCTIGADDFVRIATMPGSQPVVHNAVVAASDVLWMTLPWNTTPYSTGTQVAAATNDQPDGNTHSDNSTATNAPAGFDDLDDLDLSGFGSMGSFAAEWQQCSDPAPEESCEDE